MSSTVRQHAATEREVLDVFVDDARPNAIVPMVAAQTVLDGLTALDVRRGGCWLATPHVWQRFDRAWSGPDDPAGAQLVGSVYITHGSPTPYDVVVHHVTVTPHGRALGWSAVSVCDDALTLADLSLRDCGRTVALPTPHRPFRRR